MQRRLAGAAIAIAVGGVVLLAAPASAPAAGGWTAADPPGEGPRTGMSLVSVSASGGHGDNMSLRPAMNDSGRYVAFTSRASNLVPGDTNDVLDVFLRDRKAGTTVRVSLSTAGAEGNSDSLNPAISGNGRYVGFSSYASNLVPGDTNGDSDLFVRDLLTGRTSRVTVRSDGTETSGGLAQLSAISPNGRYVSFASYSPDLVPRDTNESPDAFVHDQLTGSTTRVSVTDTERQADSGSWTATVSANGRYVAFVSYASNLVSGDTNAAHDVFIRDRRARTTTRVNVSSAGEQSDGFEEGVGSETAAISADGWHVTFSSRSTNLVPDDTNGVADVFVRDLRAGTTTRASEPTAAPQEIGYGIDSHLPRITPDGRYVVFILGDVRVWDRQAGTTTWVGPAAFNVDADPWISADGRYVAFASDESIVELGDTNGFTDVYVRDRTR